MGRTEERSNLLTVCFRDIGWLQTNPLLPETVLDYFANSQFYLKTCNNELLKMQTVGILSQEQKLERLAQMTGVEYALVCANNGLFIIVKQERVRADTTPLEYYYILEGTIYMAPTLEEILLSRLDSMLWALDELLRGEDK